MHFALCTECVNVALWICDMLHAGMCSCLYDTVFTLLALVVCRTALEFCFVFVDLDGLGDVVGNSISIYLKE